MNAAGLACVVLVGVLLVAEVRQARGLRVVAKCGAALAMVLCAVFAGAAATAAGRRILTGLILSAGGDACLLSSRRSAFLAGLLLFAAAHLAYAAAALQMGASWLMAAAVAAGLFFPARLVWRWLSAHVPTPMRLMVLGYFVVITTMVALAIAAVIVGTAPARLAWGAALFYLSDLAVARQRFVCPSVINKLWGLPAYFGGQLLLATSL